MFPHTTFPWIRAVPWQQCRLSVVMETSFSIWILWWLPGILEPLPLLLSFHYMPTLIAATTSVSASEISHSNRKYSSRQEVFLRTHRAAPWEGGWAICDTCWFQSILLQPRILGGVTKAKEYSRGKLGKWIILEKTENTTGNSRREFQLVNDPRAAPEVETGAEGSRGSKANNLAMGWWDSPYMTRAECVNVSVH